MGLPMIQGVQAPRRKATAMLELLEHGQSVWLDHLDRKMTRSGDLTGMIEDGLRGMTSNLAIFERAIAGSSAYDGILSQRFLDTVTNWQIFDALAIQDVQEAADAFRSVYEESDGEDGFVSIEVAPALARDPQGTVVEARRLWRAVMRPNVMIKIPGTREGWPAIERCLRDGININVTLLFSVEHYQAVAEAYLRALEARVAEHLPIDCVASVASLFVSRVDTEIDRRIDQRGGLPPALHGRVAIANARLVYDAFLGIIGSSRWRALERRGARMQRPLWASTGTKNPAYSDVLYMEALIGRHTITTVPPDTLRLFEQHGIVNETLPGNVPRARLIMSTLEKGGIDFREINVRLEDEAIEQFRRSIERVLAVIGAKRRALDRVG